jgi:hypothetical protein
MIEYQYDSNGLFVGVFDNPGTILSNHSTLVATPEPMEGFVPVWNGSAWTHVEDHRGKKGYVNGEEVEIKEIGPLPEGWSDAPPPPTLDEAKAAKLAEINAAKWREIEGGQVEYGGLHFHTDSNSQSLLSSNVLIFQMLGQLPQVWKAKDGYLPITSVDQLTAIGALVAQHVEAQFGIEFTLAAQVGAAETVEAVQAIAWPVPD